MIPTSRGVIMPRARQYGARCPHIEVTPRAIAIMPRAQEKRQGRLDKASHVALYSVQLFCRVALRRHVLCFAVLSCVASQLCHVALSRVKSPCVASRWLCYAMLWYVVMWYVMLCDIILYYVMLCYATLCYIMVCIYHVTSNFVALYYIMLFVLCHVMLRCIALCYVARCYVCSYYVVLCYAKFCYHVLSNAIWKIRCAPLCNVMIQHNMSF